MVLKVSMPSIMGDSDHGSQGFCPLNHGRFWSWFSRFLSPQSWNIPIMVLKVSIPSVRGHSDHGSQGFSPLNHGTFWTWFSRFLSTQSWDILIMVLKVSIRSIMGHSDHGSQGFYPFLRVYSVLVLQDFKNVSYFFSILHQGLHCPCNILQCKILMHTISYYLNWESQLPWLS